MNNLLTFNIALDNRRFTINFHTTKSQYHQDVWGLDKFLYIAIFVYKQYNYDVLSLINRYIELVV